MLSITAVSTIPMDGSATHFSFLMNLQPDIQNLLHIPVFGLLSYLWLLAFCKCSRPFIVCWTSALLITVIFGVFDEIHQMAVPGRYAGMLDILLNTIGAGLGIGVFALHRRFYCSVDSCSS
jgi:VanZ family protein